MRLLLVVPVLGCALAGCAPSLLINEDIQRLSAQAIMPTPYPDSVRISDIKHDAKLATWVATTRNGVYDCSVEAREESRRNYPPLCAKRDTPPR